MDFRAGLIKVLSEYSEESQKKFEDNQLAQHIRETLPEALKELVDNPERYLLVGGPGKGRWAFAPWVAVLDILITDTTQEGYYPVYLFREDLTGLYLLTPV